MLHFRNSGLEWRKNAEKDGSASLEEVCRRQEGKFRRLVLTGKTYIDEEQSSEVTWGSAVVSNKSVKLSYFW